MKQSEIVAGQRYVGFNPRGRPRLVMTFRNHNGREAIYTFQDNEDRTIERFCLLSTFAQWAKERVK